MPCENCNAQFTVFKRKKSCTECRRLYCSNCLIKRKESIILCERCVIFRRRPLSKIELLKLKPKDLIFYLQSKHVSTTGCVEKEELVNLIIAQVNASTYRDHLNSPNYSTSSTSSRSFSQNSSSNATDNPFDAIKQTCQNLFSSFTEKLATDLAFDGSHSGNADQGAPRHQQQPPPSANCSNNNNTNNNISSQPRRSSKPYNSSTSESQHNSTSNSSSHFSVGQSPTSRPQQNNNDNYFNYDHDTPQPGPSGQNTIHPSMSNRTVTSSAASSFEELGAVGGTLLRDPILNGHVGEGTSNSSDITDNWQFVPRNHNDPASPSSKFNRIINSSANLPSLSHNYHNGINTSTQRITRSRSDSFIVDENSHIRRIIDNENDDHVPLQKRHRPCCTTCSLKRFDLARLIRNFRHQLEGQTSLTDAERNDKMEEFLRSIEINSALDSCETTPSRNVPSRLDIDDSATINGMPMSSDTQLSPYSGDVDEGIYVYPTIRFMFDENSHGMHNGGSANEGGIEGGGGGGGGSYANAFHNKKHRLKLSDISSKAGLNELSVKQLKEILMLNRVDFKGCCEKQELLERVQRLWQAHRATPAVEKLTTEDLCKICMDAPIECVILECGHMVTCTNCGKVLNECPICRQYIIRVVRFFRA